MEPNEQVVEIIQRNASRAAACYRRRCWWADFDDMRQEAIAAQLKAERGRTYDEELGRPLSAYLWSVALYAVRRLVHKASAPVSTSHRTENLLGLYRAPTELHLEGGHVIPHPALPSRNAEDEAIAQDVDTRVRLRVVELLGTETARFALEVMTHEWKPQEVAEANGVPVRVVYAAQRRVADVLYSDDVLRSIWEEVLE